MPPSKGKHGSAGAEAVRARQGVHPRARDAAGRAVESSLCEEALARVLQLAGALSLDNRETRGHLSSGRAVRAPAREPSAAETQGASSRAQLMAALQELEPEIALKIRTLMIAGRDGQSISDVKANLSLSDADAGFAAMAADSSENGPLLVDYLRRGHALACAMDLNLDSPLSDWQSPATLDSGERAWLNFGRQLASSLPGDWQCLGIIEPTSAGFNRLYVKLGHDAWWSFHTVLDRPTPALVDKERRALAERSVKGISAGTLDALVEQLAHVQGRALWRASRAICARVGKVNTPSSR
jgi:hypothetical protein